VYFWCVCFFTTRKTNLTKRWINELHLTRQNRT